MGHIPLKTKIKIETFKDCLEKIDNLESGIEVPLEYTEYRYLLGKFAPKCIIVMGINPSTATREKLDNTLKRVSNIIKNKTNNYSGFIMFNVYAQRATDPDEMHEYRDDELHKENLNAFKWLLDKWKGPVEIWSAWGNLIEKRGYLYDCLNDLYKISKEYEVHWLYTGNLTKDGHPHHPLGLPYSSTFQDFNMEDYISSHMKNKK